MYFHVFSDGNPDPAYEYQQTFECGHHTGDDLQFRIPDLLSSVGCALQPPDFSHNHHDQQVSIQAHAGLDLCAGHFCTDRLLYGDQPVALQVFLPV